MDLGRAYAINVIRIQLKKCGEVPRKTKEMTDAGRILIVDDEPNARAVLSELLHDAGY